MEEVNRNPVKLGFLTEIPIRKVQPEHVGKDQGFGVEDRVRVGL